MHTFGDPPDPRKIILHLQRARGFRSTRALALAAGIPQPTLSRYLAGESSDMETAQWRKLADTLEVHVSHLLGEIPLPASLELSRIYRIMENLTPADQSILLAAATAMASARSKTAS